jgi:hypothetical protein
MKVGSLQAMTAIVKRRMIINSISLLVGRFVFLAGESGRSG